MIKLAYFLLGALGNFFERFRHVQFVHLHLLFARACQGFSLTKIDFSIFITKKKRKENSFVIFKAGRGSGLIFAKLKRIAVVLGRDIFFLKLIYHCYDSNREISGYRGTNRSQTNQAPVVLRLDSTLERINHYPSEKYY